MLSDILDLKKIEYKWHIGCGMSKCIIVPNFAAFGQSMIDISRFFEFEDGSCSPSWIFKNLKF